MAGIGEANQTCHEYGKDMEVVRAAGMMIFRRTTAKDPMEYLMMRASYGNKHWTPPKGHVDPGEDILETAIRETEEESGFVIDKDYTVVKDFKVEAKYKVRSHLDGVVRPKVVTYYLAKLNDPESPVKLSEEHTEFKWLTMQEALKIGGFDNMKDVFMECEEKAKAS